MLSMLDLKAHSLGPYALIPGPKERSQMCLAHLREPVKNFSFLDYEMHTGSLGDKRVTVGNGGRFAPDTAMTMKFFAPRAPRSWSASAVVGRSRIMSRSAIS